MLHVSFSLSFYFSVSEAVLGSTGCRKSEDTRLQDLGVRMFVWQLITLMGGNLNQNVSWDKGLNYFSCGQLSDFNSCQLYPITFGWAIKFIYLSLSLLYKLWLFSCYITLNNPEPYFKK